MNNRSRTSVIKYEKSYYLIYVRSFIFFEVNLPHDAISRHLVFNVYYDTIRSNKSTFCRIYIHPTKKEPVPGVLTPKRAGKTTNQLAEKKTLFTVTLSIFPTISKNQCFPYRELLTYFLY